MCAKRYTLDERYFLVGNNCTVGHIYKDVLLRTYETPFVWNWFSYDDFTKLTLFWDDIDWKRQDFVPRLMDGDELSKRCHFKLQSKYDKWWTVCLNARDGEELFTCYPHLSLDSDGRGIGLEQLLKRRERMLNSLDGGKRPLFILARDCTENGFNPRQLDIAYSDGRIVLCDYTGASKLTRSIAFEVALPNLIERGFVREER